MAFIYLILVVLNSFYMVCFMFFSFSKGIFVCLFFSLSGIFKETHLSGKKVGMTKGEVERLVQKRRKEKEN